MRADLRLRQVGESYKDYASRMAGWARAAERDRDAALTAVAPDPAVGAEAQGVLWMSMRYALGRATYAAAECCDAIHDHCHRLSPAQRLRMADEIDRAIAADAAGMDFDIDRWRAAADALRAGLEPNGEPK